MRLQSALPRARRQGRPHGPTSRRDDRRGGGATLSTSRQTQCQSKRQGPPCTAAGRPRRTKRPEHLMGMTTAHRTASTRAPGRPVKPPAASQPAHRTSARRPGAQTRNASRQPHRRNPTGSLRARPTPPRLGSEDSPTVALEQGARKLFREAQGAPRKTRAHPRFAFTPCAAAFPQAPSAPQGAPRGRAPTRGDRQPWERASTRGRTRQSART